jgi:uncharacterized protein YfkK (UPF0435 family)
MRSTVVQMKLLILRVIVCIQLMSSHDSNTKYLPVVPSAVEAQHPIIKFVQMHTTHRNMNMMMKRMVVDGANDSQDATDNDDNEEEDEDQCRSIKQKLNIVDAKLAQSEHSVQEMAAKYEDLQHIYNTTQKEHSHQIERIEEQLMNAQKITSMQEEIAQRTIQLHSTTNDELLKVSTALQTKQSEFQSLQHQHDLSMKELQLKYDQKLSDNNKECQIRIDSIQLREKEEYKGQRKQLELAIQTIKDDQSKCSGEKNALQMQLHRVELKYEAILKDYDHSLQVYIKDNFEAAVQNQTNTAVQVVQDEYDAYQRNCALSIQQLNNEIKNMTLTMTDTMQECRSSTEQLQNEMTQQIQQLQNEYEIQHVDYTHTLQQLQEVHEQNTIQLRESLQSQYNETMQSAIVSHTETISEYKDAILTLTAENNETVANFELQLRTAKDQHSLLTKKLQAQDMEIKKLNEQYVQALESSHYWEDTFQQRSFINITYISHHVYQYTTQQFPIELQEFYIQPYIVSPILQLSYDLHQYYHDQFIQHQVVPFVHTMSDKLQKQIVVPYLNPCFQYYANNIRPHLIEVHRTYVTYGQPHVINVNHFIQEKYHRHLHPYVLDLQDSLILFYANILHELQNYLDGMLVQHSNQCIKLLQSMSTPNENNNMKKWIPPFVIQSVQYSCDNPNEALNMYMKIVLSILLIVFHRTILRLIWTTSVSILLFVVWTINPIRLLFFRRRNQRQKRLAMKTTGIYHKHSLTTNVSMNGDNHATVDNDNDDNNNNATITGPITAMTNGE